MSRQKEGAEPLRQGTIGDNSLWTIVAALKKLRAEIEPWSDDLLGQGCRLSFGEAQSDQQTTLELYPEKAGARYRSECVNVDVNDVASVSAEDDGLSVGVSGQAMEGSLRVRRDGTVTLDLRPLTRDGARREQEVIAKSIGAPVQAQTANEAETAEGASKTHSGEERAAESAQPKEGERLVLVGRVGADLFFRTTSKGNVVARFPLAVEQKGEKMHWQTCLVFGERAKKLQDSLKKGQSCQVIGYLHKREHRGRDGQTRTIEEVYAVAVKPL